MATLIKERYEILETLGAGGEARVVKALDRQHGRVVALKIRPVRDDRTRDDALNEARILLAIPPHQALPLVREDFFDDEDYVVAMDWVDGTDLARLLQDRGRPGLAPSSVLSYLSDAAEALTHLHAQTPAVIHGDLKPANLILTRGGRVKLVDFGMSSAPNALRRRSGTPGYRAPELAAGGPPSRAGDIYALAATAFALLTGSAPAGSLPRWEGIDPAQAEQLEAAIRMGMATDPARRPASPGELVERLRAGWAQALPAGVVTFCLSDIEGSTAMWNAEPTAMAVALVRHDELVADCMAAHRGRLIGSMGEGDSTVSVFHSAPDAVAAALDATRALAAEPWPAGLHIRARFGVHTGEAERRGANYFGPAINLAARLRAQADGGQVFLSSVTADLVARHLPPGCSLVDLGPHRLAGVAAPEQIHALKGSGVSAPLPGTECPYRGLLAFEPEDRAFFFGREEVVSELIGRLAPGRLLAIVGASGSGKSSVLRAGVIAAVRAGDVPGIGRARAITPGAHPDPAVDDDSAALLVVDQFEELFTLCHDADLRLVFIDALLSTGCAVVIGVRADMYGRLGTHPGLGRAVTTNQILLGAMTDDELERAVVEPAHLAGLRLEPGLVELAVREVAGEPGALPLLSHALRATWERRDGRTLTVQGYRESGGVGGAVARTADDLLDAMPAERRKLVRNVFVRLTDLGDGSTATRLRVRTDELLPEGVPADVAEALLERLAEARLVTLGEGTAEVAHEVLIREWPTLRGWLDEDEEGIRLRRQLGDAARMWEAGGREPSDLYRGPRLVAATDWVTARRPELNAAERGFIDTSVAEADRGRRAQLRVNRRLRALLAGAVALLVVAVSAGVVALIQRRDAQAQALTSDAERIGARALTEQNVDRAMLLGVAAVRLQNRAETRSDLLAVLQLNPAMTHLIRPFSDQLTGVQVSPNGRLLAVADSAGVVRLVDLGTWTQLGADVRLGDPVAPRAMSFAPDGRTLMVVTVATDRATLEAIDVTTRSTRPIHTWTNPNPLPPGGSDGVAYAPDGRSIAVSLIRQGVTDEMPTAERLLMVDAATGRVRWERPAPMRRGQEELHVTFTPSGGLVTSAQHGDTILWDRRTGRMLRRYDVGGLPAVSVDGHKVALGRNTPSNDPVTGSWVSVLDLRTGRHRTLAANLSTAWIRGIAYSRDGSRIIADAFDGVHVWDAGSGSILESYAGQPGQRSFMAVGPDVTTAFVGSQDGSVAAFDLSGARRLGQTFSWKRSADSCAGASAGPCNAVDPRTDLLADTQDNGGLAIVNLKTERLVKTLPPRDGVVADAVSFLPTGRTVVDGGSNGRVTLWDLATWRPTRTLRFSAPVQLTAPSPDGRLLGVQTQAGTSSSSRIAIVALATGRVLQTHTVPDGSGGLQFSRDGRELVAVGCCHPGSAVLSFDVRSGRELFRRTFAAHFQPAAVDPRSGMIGVGGENGDVLFLDPRTGRAARPALQAAAGSIAYIAFSPDGRSLAVSGPGYGVNVWDLRTRKQLGRSFGPYRGIIPPVLFEPDGRLLIVLVEQGVQWPTDLQAWERFACQVAGRDLTRAEWQDLLPTRRYQAVCPRNR
jgi:class 3 adenylate cyclase/WD40 repeat protein/tRNA A-37 threonylcarbamoyl transferase component Bud32